MSINVKYMLVGHILDIYKIPLQQTCTELQGADVMDDVKLRMICWGKEQPGAGCSDFAAVSLPILYLRDC